MATDEEEIVREETKKLGFLSMLPLIIGGFGRGMKFYHWIDPVRGFSSGIEGKVGCRRSSHTRWKKSRAMGYTKRSRG